MTLGRALVSVPAAVRTRRSLPSHSAAGGQEPNHFPVLESSLCCVGIWDAHEQRPGDPISQTGPWPRRTRLLRTCFLGSQMNATGGFSAPLNGDRRVHPAKTSSRQK
jgi:hypothetical protein